MTDKIQDVLVDATHIYGPDAKGDNAEPLDWEAARWSESRWFDDDEAKPEKPPKNTQPQQT